MTDSTDKFSSGFLRLIEQSRSVESALDAREPREDDADSMDGEFPGKKDGKIELTTDQLEHAKRRVLAGEVRNQVAKDYGVSIRALRASFARIGFDPPHVDRISDFDDALIDKIVDRIQEGQGPQEIIAGLKIHPSSIKRGIRLAREKMHKASL